MYDVALHFPLMLPHSTLDDFSIALCGDPGNLLSCVITHNWEKEIFVSFFSTIKITPIFCIPIQMIASNLRNV